MAEKTRIELNANVNVSELAAGVKDDFWGSIKEQVTNMMCRLIGAVLEEEIEQFVGASWHERDAAARRTYRAGYRPRRFVTLGSELVLRVPRVRIKGFRSKFLGYRKRRAEAFDEAIVDAYVAGTSMRETTALFHQMFGTSVSPRTVSKLVKRLDGERETFQSRQLTDDYTFLVFDGMYVKCMVAPAPKLKGAKRGETVEKLAVLLVRGIKADGTRELIDFRIAAGEREDAWEAFLLSLFKRGLEGKATKLFVHDGSDGLENAIESVYAAVSRQRCICHKLANVWADVVGKNKHSHIRKDASNVYDVDTADEAYQRLDQFIKKWKRLEPAAVATFCRDFDKTLTFLQVPKEQRQWISTTNAIERYIRELRRRIRPMGTFQSLASCQRLIYVAIKKLSSERRNPIPYSMWASQPGYGSKPHKPRNSSRPDFDALRKELYLILDARVRSELTRRTP